LPQGPTKIINVMTEGPTVGGESSSGRKAYTRIMNVVEVLRKKSKII